MAQLVARLVRNEKVGGSNPPSSTTGRHPIAGVGFCMLGRVGVAPVVVLLVAPLVSLAPHVLSCGPGCSVCPWVAARPRAVCAASFGVIGQNWGYRTLRVAGGVTFRRIGAGKSVF